MNTFKFLLIILIFGLLQFWVLYIYAILKEVPQDPFYLIGQSGAFFFASSLTATSFWKHFKIFDDVSKDERFFSFILFAIIIIVCLIAVFSGWNLNAKTKHYSFSPNRHHTNFAVGCLCLSLLYSLFTEHRASNK